MVKVSSAAQSITSKTMNHRDSEMHRANHLLPVINSVFLRVSAVILLLGFATRYECTAAELKPNIVILLPDDMGYADVGFNGSSDFKTPNIDQLAKRGTILTAMYGQPTCSPSRSTLLTGRYPTHTGVYQTVGEVKNDNFPLPLAEKTLAQSLREAGYTTAICGKWHLGERPEYLALQRGFDHQYGFRTGSISPFTQLSANTKKRDWHRDDKPSDDEGYDMDMITKEACRLIDQQPTDNPLVLYFAPHCVHTPWQSPEADAAPYAKLKGRLKDLAGTTAALDRNIGDLVKALKDKGILDNTLIIYSSDNGGPSWNGTTKNTPLRGGKAQIYEGGVRLCSFVTWPGKIPAGITNNEPLHLVDWYPTLLKLVGSSVNQKLPVDGFDIWPVLTKGAKTPNTEILLMGSQVPESAIRMGDWKLLLNPTDAKKGKGGSTDSAGMKIGGERVELYNVVDDISEQHDLAAEEPERVQTMIARLKELIANPANPDHFKEAKKRGKKADDECDPAEAQWRGCMALDEN